MHFIAFYSTTWKSLVSLKCKFLLIEYNNIQLFYWILRDSWKKENVIVHSREIIMKVGRKGRLS